MGELTGGGPKTVAAAARRTAGDPVVLPIGLVRIDRRREPEAGRNLLKLQMIGSRRDTASIVVPAFSPRGRDCSDL
jgi:hypothetical protein